MSTFKSFGSPVLYSQKFVDQAEDILSLKFEFPSREKLFIHKSRIQREIDQLEKILVDDFSEIEHNKCSFPVIEFGIKNRTGFLETLTVHIKRASKNEFIIIPSGANIDQSLYDQFKTSWNFAKKYCESIINIKDPSHQVIVQFDRKLGEYTGNSLGVSLSLSFIQSLLEFYNAQKLIKAAEHTTFTGAVDINGNIGAVSEEIITQKTNIVFFSPVKIFAVPKEDFEFAQKQVEKLVKQYPFRELKLTAIEDLDSLILRRDLVQIDKQSLFKRSGKLIMKNKSLFAAIIFLPLFLHFFALLSVDANPWDVRFEQNRAIIVNKSGEVLWTKKMRVDFSIPIYLSTYNRFKIVADIDDDELNEVILCQENLESTEPKNELGRIACFDNKGNLIWKYLFSDKIQTNKDNFNKNFHTYIGGLINREAVKTLVLVALHSPLYPTAIYKINALNGKRIRGTLWHPGHLNGKIIMDDFDDDGKLELFTSGINNAYNSVTGFIIEIDKINGMAPSTEPYKFKGKTIADFDEYILFPKTDFANKLNYRYNAVFVNNGHYLARIEKLVLKTAEEIYEKEICIGVNYYYSPLSSDIEIEPGDNFKMKRDSLVNAGLLNQPLTDTKEYRELLLANIRFWNGEKFVTQEEYLPKEKISKISY